MGDVAIAVSTGAAEDEQDEEGDNDKKQEYIGQRNRGATYPIMQSASCSQGDPDPARHFLSYSTRASSFRPS